MNSKLRNSLSAFTASGATLAIALMVAVPAGTTPVQDVFASQDLSPRGHGLQPARRSRPAGHGRRLVR